MYTPRGTLGQFRCSENFGVQLKSERVSPCFNEGPLAVSVQLIKLGLHPTPTLAQACASVAALLKSTSDPLAAQCALFDCCPPRTFVISFAATFMKI